MNYVKSEQRAEELVKKSRFIGVIIPCNSPLDANGSLKQLSEEFADATHIAYAYRLITEQGLCYRFHDAGEPTGTAGRPIYQQLDGNDLVNVLIVVIRYYGGIKLGAGGLTRAYGNTARNVIRLAELEPYIDKATVQLTLDYKQLQPLEYLLKKLDGQIIQQNFAGHVELTLRIPAHQLAKLKQCFPNAC